MRTLCAWTDGNSSSVNPFCCPVFVSRHVVIVGSYLQQLSRILGMNDIRDNTNALEYSVDIKVEDSQENYFF